MRKKVNKKLIVALLSFVLLFGGTFGSSLAWLLDNTEDVTNTFSTSDIEIILEETDTDTDADGDQYNYQMIPGHSVVKDPKVYVSSDSEDCYVFVEVTESENLGNFIKYAVDVYDENNNPTGKWHRVPSENNVYYTIIDDANEKGAEKAISILGAGEYGDDGDTYRWNVDEVLTLPTVTKDMMDDLTDSTKPTLTFKAYAVQLWKTNEPAEGADDATIAAAQFTPEKAWKIAKDLD